MYGEGKVTIEFVVPKDSEDSKNFLYKILKIFLKVIQILKIFHIRFLRL